jgi:polyisoprenoid-binding protein YceI
MILAAAGLSLAACTQAPESHETEAAKAQPAADVSESAGRPVDVGASVIQWIGTKVSGYHEGTLKLKSGEVFASGNELTGARLTIDMTSLAVTGPEGASQEMNDKLLGHLKSPDFFDVAAHPEATIEVTGVAPYDGAAVDAGDERQRALSPYVVADPSHTISANLTLHGVTKNIAFPARVTANPDGSFELVAKFNIDRQEWGISYAGKPDDLIRDAVHLGISVKTRPAAS